MLLTEFIELMEINLFVQTNKGRNYLKISQIKRLIVNYHSQQVVSIITQSWRYYRMFRKPEKSYEGPV